MPIYFRNKRLTNRFSLDNISIDFGRAETTNELVKRFDYVREFESERGCPGFFDVVPKFDKVQKYWDGLKKHRFDIVEANSYQEALQQLQGTHFSSREKYWKHDAYVRIIFGLNIIARICEFYTEIPYDEINTDYLCIVGNDYPASRRWENIFPPEIGDIRVLNIPRGDFDVCLNAIENANYPVFWQTLIQLFNSQECLQQIQAEVSICDQPISSLAREYHDRKKKPKPLITAKDLAQLIETTSLPDEAIDIIHAMITKNTKGKINAN